MRLNKTNILSNFEGYDERVLDNLSLIIDELKSKKVQVNNYSLVIFQLLATQFSIYFKAQDTFNKSEELTSTDDYKRKSKAPELAALQKAHTEIIHLLDKLGLSPLEEAKIKKLKEKDTKDEDAKELLNTLLS